MTESMYTSLKPFGLNVIPQRTTQEVKKSVGDAVGSLWGPVLDYIETNENVFSGDVAREIESYNFQTMRLGMEARQNETKHDLNLQG